MTTQIKLALVRKMQKQREQGAGASNKFLCIHVYNLAEEYGTFPSAEKVRMDIMGKIPGAHSVASFLELQNGYWPTFQEQEEHRDMILTQLEEAYTAQLEAYKNDF